MTERIPERLRGDVIRRIGHGGEATVYELTGGRALRVFHRKPHATADLRAFYDQIAAAPVSFALPQIIEQGEDDGIAYSVDRLLDGRPLDALLPQLSGNERQRALLSYTDAAFEIASLPVARDQYGEFLRDDDAIARASWSDYLLARMQRSLRASAWLATHVERLDLLVAALAERIRALPPARKALVHGDYFPGNVLIAADQTVAAVIDFGPMTVIGDPSLDLVSALIFLEVVPGNTPADTEFGRARLVDPAGASILEAITTYRAWYAVRFAPYRNDDPNLYAWCVASLQQAGTELAG
jgi:aminoglycoside phosphotransferase (APT) family kinase protein